METIFFAIKIAIVLLSFYSIYDIWVKRDYEMWIKIASTLGLLIFPGLGIIIYWVVIRRVSPTKQLMQGFGNLNLPSRGGEAKVVLRGRGGHNVEDVAAAIRDAKENAETIYGYFYTQDNTFKKFYELDEKYKKEAMEPLIKLLNQTDMEYIRYNAEDSDGMDEHYDYYVGQINSAGERHGLGMYSFEWTVCQKGNDDEPYAQMKYIICEWRNNKQASNGYVYCFSSDEEHTWLMCPGHYKITADEGWSRL